jgi:hypothetical protein
MYFDNAKKILERLGVKNPMKTILFNYHDFNNTEFSKFFIKNKIKNIQNSGKKEDVIIEYKNEKYIFNRTKEGDFMYYALHQNKVELQDMCIMIIIDKDENTCSIHTISYDEKCFENKKGSGSDLLKLALLLIDKIKERYKIQKITLTDNSSKRCKNNKNINLSKMMTLLTGDTWYGKYGFRPKIKEEVEKYEENKNKINNLLLHDVPFFKKMLENALNKYHGKNKKLISTIMNAYDENMERNKKLKYFLSYLMEYYEELCETFYDLYEILFTKLELYDFYAKNFIKYI